MLRTLLLIAALSACSCSGGSGSACHADADCAAGLACAGPNDRQGCGIAPREECASDANCTGVGGRCHLIDDPCSADGFGSECGPACTGDAACGAGLRCDAGDVRRAGEGALIHRVDERSYVSSDAHARGRSPR